MRPLLPLIVAACAAFVQAAESAAPAAAQGPLRVFMRSGPKSHGPGCHDHPAFLRDWTVLLKERGARVTGGDVFPTAADLADVEVMVIHRQVGGNFRGVLASRFHERSFFLFSLSRCSAGAVAGGDASADHYRDMIGGSWRQKVTKWREGPMQLTFVDRGHRITADVADFGMDDEIYYDMDLRADIHVLATAPTPKKKDDGFEAQPQIWTYEKPGAQRAFVFIPGHRYANFARADVQRLLLRGIAWAGRRDPSLLTGGK